MHFNLQPMDVVKRAAGNPAAFFVKAETGYIWDRQDCKRQNTEQQRLRERAQRKGLPVRFLPQAAVSAGG